MKFANYYSLVFSVFFLFVLIAPTIVLFNSDKETFSVEVILEETEKKDMEDIKVPDPQIPKNWKVFPAIIPDSPEK